MSKNHSLVIIINFIFFASCFTAGKISNQNLAGMYWNQNAVLKPKFQVIHISDTISRLYVSINRAELLFSRENSENRFSAAVIIGYNLYDSFESTELLDSAFARYTIVTETPDKINNENDAEKNIIYSMDFKARAQKSYLFEPIVKDEKRNQTSKSYLTVNKTSGLNYQNFLVMLKDETVPLFRNYIHKREALKIAHTNTENSQLYGSYYLRDFPVALPPFAISGRRSFNFNPDSAFVVNTGEPMILEQEGFFHFRIDTIFKEGYTLFRYYEDFPNVSTAEQLYQPLKYITTRQEFDGLYFEVNKKSSIDNFWLKIAGNHDRAKRIIKAYYNRVQEANIFFTSYMEGWKTDRGMMYIVYGPPDIVYKSTYSESWIYGQEENIMSLNFTFAKVNNPFTENDYELNRSAIYKNSWYLAVDAWRQGVVY